jgi:F0F1-type ATP synthase membrane subunit a
MLFIVLNIVEELARVISLTLRLFGNIGGEHQVKLGLFTMMFAALAQAVDFSSLMTTAGNGMLFGLLWGVSVFVTLIGTLGGFIQAMVFTMLTLSYFSHAVALEH